MNGPAGGTLTVDGPGRFTYRPSDIARTAAAGTPGLDTDTFTVQIDDGHGTPTTTSLFVQIAPTRIAGETSVSGSLSANGNYFNDNANRAVVVTSSGFSGNTVTVVDTTTGAQVGSGVNVTGFVVATALTADGSRVVVTSRGDQTQTMQATVINTATGAQVGTTISVVGQTPMPTDDSSFNQLGAVLNSQGSRAVLTANTSGGFGDGTTRFAIIDTATGTQLGTTVSASGVLYSTPKFNSAGDRVVTVTRSFGSGFNPSSGVVVINAATGRQAGTTVTAAGLPWQTLTNADGTRFAFYSMVYPMAIRSPT